MDFSREYIARYINGVVKQKYNNTDNTVEVGINRPNTEIIKELGKEAAFAEKALDEQISNNANSKDTKEIALNTVNIPNPPVEETIDNRFSPKK